MLMSGQHVASVGNITTYYDFCSNKMIDRCKWLWTAKSQSKVPAETPTISISWGVSDESDCGQQFISTRLPGLPFSKSNVFFWAPQAARRSSVTMANRVRASRNSSLELMQGALEHSRSEMMIQTPKPFNRLLRISSHLPRTVVEILKPALFSTGQMFGSSQCNCLAPFPTLLALDGFLEGGEGLQWQGDPAKVLEAGSEDRRALCMSPTAQ